MTAGELYTRIMKQVTIVRKIYSVLTAVGFELGCRLGIIDGRDDGCPEGNVGLVDGCPDG
jgi:hypothetical protein